MAPPVLTIIEVREIESRQVFETAEFQAHQIAV